MTTPFPLGRTLEHDPESRNYEHSVRRLVTPRDVTHTLAAPHLNQGSLGSCEGNTAAEFLSCAKALNNRRNFWRKQQVTSTSSYLTEKQAVSLYSKATQLDNDQIPGQYPPSDTGTSGVGVAKSMQFYGGLQQYNWTFTWDAFLSTLQTQPVMLGLNWYEDMFEVDSAGFVNVGGSLAGGHAILAYAVSFTKQYIGCTNHWVNQDGTPWGIKIGQHQGSFKFRFPDLERLLIHEEGDSLVPVLL